MNSLLGFVALIVSVAVGFGTLRRRANEPNKQRWAEFVKWKTEVDEKMARDSHNLAQVEKQMSRRYDFEHIMLASMKGILSHLAEGNHDDQLRRISKDIDEYLLGRHKLPNA